MADKKNILLLTLMLSLPMASCIPTNQAQYYPQGYNPPQAAYDAASTVTGIPRQTAYGGIFGAASMTAATLPGYRAPLVGLLPPQETQALNLAQQEQAAALAKLSPQETQAINLPQPEEAAALAKLSPQEAQALNLAQQKEAAALAKLSPQERNARAQKIAEQRADFLLASNKMIKQQMENAKLQAINITKQYGGDSRGVEQNFSQLTESLSLNADRETLVRESKQLILDMYKQLDNINQGYLSHQQQLQSLMNQFTAKKISKTEYASRLNTISTNINQTNNELKKVQAKASQTLAEDDKNLKKISSQVNNLPTHKRAQAIEEYKKASSLHASNKEGYEKQSEKTKKSKADTDAMFNSAQKLLQDDSDFSLLDTINIA